MVFGGHLTSGTTRTSLVRRSRLQDRPPRPAARIGGNRHAIGESDVGFDGGQKLRTLALKTIGTHIRERQHILAIMVWSARSAPSPEMWHVWWYSPHPTTARACRAVYPRVPTHGVTHRR